MINDQRSEEVYHRCIWSKATAIADSIGIQLQKPRTAGQMRPRANATCTLTGTAEEYYRINTYLPFVDHCLSELNNRFSDETRPSFLAFKLLPGRINTLTRHEFEDIVERFQTDLADKDGISQEFERWKTFCGNLPNDGSERSSLSNAIILADFYPNLHVIFRILLTMPVGSVPCERSFSAMRRLKHWGRSTMTEDRLVGLALLFVHRHQMVSVDNILTKFANSKKRRIGPLNF